MKSLFVVPLTCTALVFACALTIAQTRAPTAPLAPSSSVGISPAPAQPSTPTPNNVADPADPDAPSAGHDGITGNDQVNPNGSVVQQGIGAHPDFKTLDINNRGYLTADDVKGNQWLITNFARCDSNHDGKLSQQEYANCH